MPIQPARLEYAPDGTPYSSAYGDVYHSSDGGLGQAHHVFLAGNQLPQRWQRRRHFTVLETGFGLGLNFLATWQAWRNDPARCERLHFVSCELHPFERHDLVQLHQRWPEFAALAEELQGAWPTLVPGLHRLHLDQGRVTLTLGLGDATHLLGQFDLQADAFYLDGFSPAKNPELWSPRLFHQLARLASPRATLATWSVAGEVREGLRRAGFEVAKAPGFGGKRQMLLGSYGGRDYPAPQAAGDTAAHARHALILGAGVAGTSLAERLAARGWTVDIVDAASGPGQGASGNHAGVLRPLPSLDDNRMSRLTRAGSLYGLRHIAALGQRGLSPRWNANGVLHLGRDEKQEQKMAAVVERHVPPPSFLRFVDAQEASGIAGWPVSSGGWWFPSSGWVQPPSLCRANLAAHPEKIRAHFSVQAVRLERDTEAEGWRLLSADGGLIASAPVAILASGVGITAFPEAAALPVVSARGQVSLLPASAGSPPKVVVCRGGYVSPEVDGLRCAGATFSVDDEETRLRDADHLENLEKLEAMLPGYTRPFQGSPAAGRVGFRPASPDRLPMVGALPVPGTYAPSTPLAQIPRHHGLYAVSGFGARGLVWASLMAEALAARLENEPMPLEKDLWEAVDPARYLLRPRRQPLREE